MLVTAVITTHKRPPELLERAIKSVLNQTHQNIELIVVDDSPVEYELRSAVKALVESYATKNVTYVPHEKVMGACAARNSGLARAKGEFIGFLDDDDEWLPNKIEEQIKAFDSKDVALVYCGSLTVFDSTGKQEERKCIFTRENVYEKLMYENFIGSTSFPLLRTEVLRQIGGFDVEMLSSQDYDVWLRIAKNHAVNYVKEPLVLYHWHEGDQITKNPAKKIAGLERILSKNMDYIKKHKDVYWLSCMSLIVWYVRAGDRKKAFSIWLKTIFKEPFKVKDNAKYLYTILINGR